VRVHQEVRDYGMVVDPGCMKCMDCVSVCPNDALSFAFAKPAFLVKPRTQEAKAGKVRRPDYDLSWPEEVVLALVMFGLFVAFRGFLNQVPLLFAIAIAAVGAFCVWKLWCLARVQNVRLQSLQLKVKGRLRPAGWVLACTTVAMLVVAAWSGAVRGQRWVADAVDYGVTVPLNVVYSPEYVPDPQQLARAQRAIRLLERSGPVDEGGMGWALTAGHHVRLSWLYAVSDDLEKSAEHLRKAVESRTPRPEWVTGLANTMVLKGRPLAEVEQLYRDVLERHPELQGVRLAMSILLFRQGRADEAGELAAAVLESDSSALQANEIVAATEVAVQTGRSDRARVALDRWIERRPDEAHLRFGRALLRIFNEDAAGALEALDEAIARNPTLPLYHGARSQVLMALGRSAEAMEAARRADELARPPQGPR
jgi:Tfp pilus assembly protein PilF/ferredoxin